MRRLRRSTKKKLLYVTGGLLLQSFLFFTCFAFTEHRSVQRYEKTVKEKEERIRGAERKVFVTTKELCPGEAFTAENTEYVLLLSEQEESLLATVVEGCFASAELPAGRIVYVTDCCERSPVGDEKECVFYDIGDVEYFEDFATVDVRIRYGNGENYCVLRGKTLTKQTEEKSGCSFCLTEEEQLLMSGAAYDAETYRGTTLYLVGTKEIVQDEPENMFLPPLQTLMQLEGKEGNETAEYRSSRSLRLALEERLAEHEGQRINGLR